MHQAKYLSLISQDLNSPIVYAISFRAPTPGINLTNYFIQ